MITLFNASTIISIGKIITLFLATGTIFQSLQHQPTSTSTQPVVQAHVDMEMPESNHVNGFDYRERIPSGFHFLAENFFEDYDKAVAQVNKLRSFGILDAAITYSDGTNYNVRAGLYIVMISKHVQQKEILYDIMQPLRSQAQNHLYELNATRIVTAL